MEKNKVRKKALITGITGQDGSYLAELLVSKDYEVHGLIRRSSIPNLERISSIYSDEHKSDNVFLHYGDLSDSSNLFKLIDKISPDEIYNLGAQSHVGVGFDVPEYTANVVGLGALRLLEAIRETKVKTRFFQASSSEMFGKIKKVPQNEKTPFYPKNSYGTAKLFAYWTTVNYRESFGIHVSNGILFNHESPRRGDIFVTKKITTGVAEILAGKRDKLYLGNLDAKRDWGYAPEYVDAMWRMLQQEEGDDYVVATGETHSVKEFVQEAFRSGGIKNWEDYVVYDSRYTRPSSELDTFLGDASKARAKLDWKPKITFKKLIKIMVEADCKKLGVKLN